MKQSSKTLTRKIAISAMLAAIGVILQMLEICLLYTSIQQIGNGQAPHLFLYLIRKKRVDFIGLFKIACHFRKQFI